MGWLAQPSLIEGRQNYATNINRIPRAIDRLTMAYPWKVPNIPETKTFRRLECATAPEGDNASTKNRLNT